MIIDIPFDDLFIAISHTAWADPRQLALRSRI
jgi:hypothetical protein